MMIRDHKMMIRDHGMIIRDHELMIRDHGMIMIRDHEMLIPGRAFVSSTMTCGAGGVQPSCCSRTWRGTGGRQTIGKTCKTIYFLLIRSDQLVVKYTVNNDMMIWSMRHDDTGYEI